MITLRTHAPLLYMTWLSATLYNLQLYDVPGVEFKNSLYAFGQSEKRKWVQCIIMILIIGFTAIRPSISSLSKSATAYFITKCDGLFLKSAWLFQYKVWQVLLPFAKGILQIKVRWLLPAAIYTPVFFSVWESLPEEFMRVKRISFFSS